MMQAHYINNRTMEIFRQIPGVGGHATLAAAVAARSPPLLEWRKFIYCESVTGVIIGEVDHFKVYPDLNKHILPYIRSDCST